MKFLVVFEGRKFDSDVDGRSHRVGFYASRHVEAASVEAIRIKDSIDALLEELRRESIHASADSVVNIADVSEYEPSSGGKVGGFTFFPDETLLRKMLNRLRNR